MMRKTNLMLQVEEHYHRPLAELLPDMYNKMGLLGMAKEMDVSPSTVWYWLLRYGVNIQRVALAAGETLEIKKK